VHAVVTPRLKPSIPVAAYGYKTFGKSARVDVAQRGPRIDGITEIPARYFFTSGRSRS
jgi:hypothetical protein